MRSCAALARGLLLLSVAFGFAAVALGTTAAPPKASVYFISPKNGDAVTNSITVQFGLTGMGIAPAGDDKPNTGHHHLLIDTTLSPDELKQPILSDARHLHFGGGKPKPNSLCRAVGTPCNSYLPIGPTLRLLPHSFRP
jgi:hypothetical protein